jgi:hypothetical protein
MLRDESGQILPGLVVVLVATLALGVGAFQVGKASILRSEAQTAADAAALAAAENIRDQLNAQVARTGTSSLDLIDDGAVRAAAANYAAKNGGLLRDIERDGADVKVWARTNEELGKDAREVRREDKHGLARARARLNLVASFSFGAEAGASIGPRPSGGDGRISDKQWKEFGRTLDHHPPMCSDNPRENDVAKLGFFLLEHGFVVIENAHVGDNPAPGVHSSTGWHYKCANSGALDVNMGANMAAIDAIIGPLQDMGFRTIWRAPDHYDHVHIDSATGGSIGSGFGYGGAVGALEDNHLEVKLIDWEAPEAQYYGFGIPGGGSYYAGSPDPGVARAICAVADRLNVNDKVLLSGFEAAIIESGVRSLPYGDRDSIGVFQQRDSWGTYDQRMNPEWAATAYFRQAIIQDRKWGNSISPGWLAQKVQISAFGWKYDTVQSQAIALINQYCR